MNKILLAVLGLPKSIYINLKYFEFKDAIKLPIIVSYRTKFLKLKGSIKIKGKIKTGMIRIGICGSGTASYIPTILELYNGEIIFDEHAYIGGGCQICNSGKMEIGNNVSFTGECHIICKKHIAIGSNSMISWNTQIMDTDSHFIYEDNNIINADDEIIIGNKVWISSNTNILKGTVIGNNNIVASGSIITNKFYENNCILTGMPIKVLKRNIKWEI